MELEASNQPKQERSRTRWIASLEKIFTDLVVKHKHETIKVKDCPIYEQLYTIFIDSATNEKYAQSSHYEELDKSIGTEAASCLEAKEKETDVWEINYSLDQDTCNAMAEALLDMVVVSRLRAVVSSVRDDKFFITNYIEALDEIKGIDLFKKCQDTVNTVTRKV
ncbi:cell cycle checkpoint protein RAD17 [Spatholobus suberectus]|nr:cell cycle checkpoint protein RAD17 [Spatholobus suberectus]